MKSLFILFQHLVPQHLLSRLVGKLASSQIPWVKNIFIRRFIRRYGVDMNEAMYPTAQDYASFNAFFTRQLKPDARPISDQEDAIVSPADGTVSAIGYITGNTLIQAKDRGYSLIDLLGGSATMTTPFMDGSFATIYLSPKDYHRVHMPLPGTLRKMVYIPGQLFSVNQTTSERIPDLFARNERAVCLFETDSGPMAVILVGAMIVAGIETVWSGRVAPARHGLEVIDYSNHHPPIQFGKGEEMGRFMLGSTVIVLLGPGAASWQEKIGENSRVKMGESIGTSKQAAAGHG